MRPFLPKEELKMKRLLALLMMIALLGTFAAAENT